MKCSWEEIPNKIQKAHCIKEKINKFNTTHFKSTVYSVRPWLWRRHDWGMLPKFVKMYTLNKFNFFVYNYISIKLKNKNECEFIFVGEKRQAAKSGEGLFKMHKINKRTIPSVKLQILDTDCVSGIGHYTENKAKLLSSWSLWSNGEGRENNQELTS